MRGATPARRRRRLRRSSRLRSLDRRPRTGTGRVRPPPSSRARRPLQDRKRLHRPKPGHRWLRRWRMHAAGEQRRRPLRRRRRRARDRSRWRHLPSVRPARNPALRRFPAPSPLCRSRDPTFRRRSLSRSASGSRFPPIRRRGMPVQRLRRGRPRPRRRVLQTPPLPRQLRRTVPLPVSPLPLRLLPRRGSCGTPRRCRSRGGEARPGRHLRRRAFIGTPHGRSRSRSCRLRRRKWCSNRRPHRSRKFVRCRSRRCPGRPAGATLRRSRRSVRRWLHLGPCQRQRSRPHRPPSWLRR